MLCFNGVVIAKGGFEPTDKIIGIGNEFITPTIQTKVLAKKITGFDLMWTKSADVKYTGIQLEALQSFDLKSALPTNGSELRTLMVSRANQQLLPLRLKFC